MKKRFISMFLVCVVCLSFFSLSVHAVSPTFIEPSAFFNDDRLPSELDKIKINRSDECGYVCTLAYIQNRSRWIEYESKDFLQFLATYWNQTYADKYSIHATVSDYPLDDGTKVHFVRMILEESVYTGRESVQWCLCDGSGKIFVSPEDPAAETMEDGQWIPMSMATSASYFHMISRDALYNFAVAHGYKEMETKGKYMICDTMGRTVWADSSGLPYAAWVNSTSTATNQDRPGTTVKDENGDTATDEDGNPLDGSTGDMTASMDMSNMTIVLPGGKQLVADQIIYDESTKTYLIDSHDTYNYEYNYYYTWNYYINYTSITYIGQTEEYNKYYKVYYELPDGRDSADLTAEELEQLNLDFDVIDYGRVSDDTSVRSLYHFDGDTRDSSYWNYKTSFDWNVGSSLTYMESGNFEGALYLDEQAHSFTLGLPSALLGDDFTLQFRYYQSATLAPQTDSYISFGTSKVMQFDGAHILTGNGTTAYNMPVGTWNEIALIRDGSMLYYYLNGIAVYSQSISASYTTPTINFYFGGDQQTYKYFDELRVLSKALVKDGSSYECTSVPHDTNLSLVLPGDREIADEYWSIEHGPDEQYYLDYSTGALLDTTAAAYSSSLEADVYYTSALVTRYDHASSKWGYHPEWTSVVLHDDYITLTGTKVTLPSNGSASYLPTTTGEAIRFPSGLSTAVYRKYTTNPTETNYFGYDQGTISVLLSDGTVYSSSFDLTTPMKSQYTTFSWGSLGYFVAGNNGTLTQAYGMVGVVPKAGTSINIKGIALDSGTDSAPAMEWVTSVTVIPGPSLRVPMLAVRSEINVSCSQIGGARPSVPVKGQVWALVEGQYITSLQIYTGTAWEAVDGRIWTGERWIPYSSYNVVTLKDMYDIVDGSGSGYEYIYTESGFWAWWQKSWNSFVERFFASGGASGSGSSIAPSTIKDALANALSSFIEGLFTLLTEVLQKLIGAATDLLTGIFSFLTDTVLGGVTEFFTSLGDGSLTEFFQQSGTDADGSTTTTTGLPSGIGAAFAFFSGVIMLLPPELRSILFFGVGLMLFMAVLKLVKE